MIGAIFLGGRGEENINSEEIGMYFPSADRNYIVRKKITDPETKHLEFIAFPTLAPATPILGPPLSGRKIYV